MRKKDLEKIFKSINKIVWAFLIIVFATSILGFIASFFLFVFEGWGFGVAFGFGSLCLFINVIWFMRIFTEAVKNVKEELDKIDGNEDIKLHIL